MSAEFFSPTLKNPFDTTLPDYPYAGLRPFTSHDWPVFFGRETMIEEVMSRVVRDHLVVVHGDSGCGKSSLVRAGVLVQLQQGYAAQGNTWRTCAMLPRANPLGNLAAALASLNDEEPSNDRILEIEETLYRGAGALDPLLKLLDLGPGENVCMLIDQFEELFRFGQENSHSEAQIFTDFIVSIEETKPAGLFAILTMRSEFFGACAQYRNLAEAVNRTQFLLPKMFTRDVMRAIQEPPLLYECHVNRELAEHLVSEAWAKADSLPLIQHGLLQILQAKIAGQAKEGGKPSIAGQELGMSDLPAGQSLSDLISSHADVVLEKLTAHHPGLEAKVGFVFRALTDINSDGNAIRRPQKFKDLRQASGTTSEELHLILDAFRHEGESFITPFAGAPISDETLIDISHEAFIRCWKRISDPNSGWLHEEFQDGLIWKSLCVSADAADTLSSQATADRENWVGALPSRHWALRYGDEPGDDPDHIWQPVDDLLKRSAEARERRISAERHMRRATKLGLAASLVLFVIAASVGYLAYQANTEARKRAQEALFSQSQFLAGAANLQAELGDVTTAMLLALEALPDDNSENTEQRQRPSSAEPMIALDGAVRKFRERAVLHGHENNVTVIQISADGEFIVTGSADDTARVWSSKTGNRIATLAGHTARLTSIALSPDGSSVVTGSADGTARLWDLKTGTPGAVLKGHDGPVRAVAFDPAGAVVLTGSEDMSAIIWDAKSGAQRFRLQGHQGAVTSLRVSKDAKVAMTGSLDNSMRLWDLNTGAPSRVRSGTGRKTKVVAIAPEGSFFLSSQADHHAEIRLHGAEAGDKRLLGHELEVTSIAIAPDASFAVTGSQDNTARIWDLRSGAQRAELVGHERNVEALAIAPDGSFVVTGSTDRDVRVWDAATGQLRTVLKAHGKSVSAIAVSPDGSFIVTGSKDNTARIWSTAVGAERLVLTGHNDDVRAVAVSRDGSIAVSGGSDGTARIWDVHTGTQWLVLDGHAGDVRAVAVSSDGAHIVTGSKDGTAKVWELSTGTDRLVLNHTKPVRSVAISPDGTLVATAGEDNLVRIWEFSTGSEHRALSGHTEEVHAVQFSPDGRFIVSGSRDGTARIWDVATGTERKALPHKQVVRSVSISADSKLIATGTGENTAKLWDAETGELRRTFQGHGGDVNAVAISQDGRFVLTGSTDETARIWAIQGDARAVLRGHESRIRSVAFGASPQGSFAVTGSADGTVRIWAPAFDRQALIERAKTLVPRCLTEKQRKAYHLSPTVPAWCDRLGKWVPKKPSARN